jgi:hypothetical protein
MSEELNLGKLFANFISFVVRNSKLLLGFVLVNSLIVMLYLTFIQSPRYSSVAICSSNITQFESKNEFQRPAVDLINHLQMFVDRKDFIALGNLLGIETNIARQFIKIDAEQLHQLDLNEDYMTLEKFNINIIVRSNKFYDEIEDGFLYYFNNNKFLIDISSLYFEGRRRLYSDVIEEINDLQGQRGLKAGGDFINTEVIASNTVNEIFYLSSVRERINKEMKYELLSYVQPFSRITMPNNFIFIWTVLCAALSFILALLIAFIKDLKIK